MTDSPSVDTAHEAATGTQETVDAGVSLTYPNYEDLKSWNLIARIKPLLDTGVLFINNETGMIEQNARMSYNTPWIFRKGDPDRNCNLWHKVMFQGFDIIPRGCLKCWKVVVGPRTLKELFQLMYLQARQPYISKCGIEKREYVNRDYGGYYYNNSKEEGLEKLDIVREAVHSQISPDIKVVLKRYCSEFEIKLGPSEDYEPTSEDLEWEKLVEAAFNFPKSDINQPDFVKAHVHQSWIEDAWKRREPGVEEFNNGEPIVPMLTTYERDGT